MIDNNIYQIIESQVNNFVGLSFTEEEKALAKEINERILIVGVPSSVDCNLKCKFCFTDTHNNPNELLPLSKRLKVIDAAKDLGAKTIITGASGEPFCDKDFISMMNYGLSKGFDYIVFTNLTAVTEEIAKMLYSNNVGVFGSFHSLNKDVYEEITQKTGAFDRMMDGCNNLLNAGYSTDNFAICCVVSKKNYDEFYSIVEYWGQKGIRVYPEYCNITGFGESHIDELYVPFKDYIKLREGISTKFPGYGALAPLVTLEGHCFTGEYAIIVGIDGTITRCYDPGSKGIIGNINNTSLRDAVLMKKKDPCFCRGYDYCPGRNMFLSKGFADSIN